MSLHPRHTLAALGVVTITLGAPAALHAQSRALFTWSGRVDREVLLVMRGGDLDARLQSGDNSERGDGRVRAALPRRPGVVELRVQDGRGAVDRSGRLVLGVGLGARSAAVGLARPRRRSGRGALAGAAR